MRVNNITIYFKFGEKFTIQQNDWENAPYPICMRLVDNNSWRKVADKLEKVVNYCYSNEWDDDELYNFIWAEYERIVLEECNIFYYDDMTDAEELMFDKLVTEEQRDKFAEKVYNRIKNDNHINSINMYISDKKRYGENLASHLSKLEQMHDYFREQKEFCFTQMFTEFGIKCGDSINVNITLELPTLGKMNVFNISWGSDEYVYLTAKNAEGNEMSIEPYYLDAYDDFEYVFSEVYDYLSKMKEKKKPTDEFAMATYNYLMEECKFADENHTDLDSFASELRGHNLSPIERLFDVNIGSFCFTIRLTSDGNYIVADNFEIWDRVGNVLYNETITNVKERLNSKK